MSEHFEGNGVKRALVEEGKPSTPVSSALLAAGEAVRLVARKLVEESAANVTAAEGMLAMLKTEHERFAFEVSHAADNFAARVNEYMSAATSCAQSLSAHREAILDIVRTVADDPAHISALPPRG